MKAYLFPGQGSQFLEIGKSLYKTSDKAKKLFHIANDILGFKITKIMFDSSIEILKNTINNQLAIYIYSVIYSKINNNFNTDTIVAGNSLGEISALAAINFYSFEDGLILVKKRSKLMEKVCKKIPGTMAVIFGLPNNIIELTCKKINGIVVPSNYNGPNQLVISGEINAIKEACNELKHIGAKKIHYLPVHGAFHSPIMETISEKFSDIVFSIKFNTPICPIYQNIHGKPVLNCKKIQINLIKQLTHPVQWEKTINNMIIGGATNFIEIGEKKYFQKIAMRMLKNFNKRNNESKNLL